MSTDRNSRLDLRASVVCCTRGHLVLSIRSLHAQEGELLAALPGPFTVDGELARGTLILIADPAGSHRITYCGDGDRQHDDYVSLRIRHLGFDAAEPLAPLDVTATVEPGIVCFDAVPAERWVPRHWMEDIRVRRVMERLAIGERASRIMLDLPRRERAMLADDTSGPEVPPHVLLLRRNYSEKELAHAD